MRISDWSSDVCSSDLFAELSVQFSQALNGIGGDLIVEPFALDEAGQFIEFAERDRRQFSYDDDLLFDRPESSPRARRMLRSEEHTSEIQTLMRISYAVF